MLIYVGCLVLSAQNNEGKEKAISVLRNQFFRELTVKDKSWKPLMMEIDSLMPDGSFSDIRDTDLHKEGIVINDSLLVKAFNRVWHISEALRDNRLTIDYNRDTWDRCQKAILRYGKMELSRPKQPEHVPTSCREIPGAAVNIYFCHLKLMEKAEQDSLGDIQLKATSEMLKTLARQAWTQPLGENALGNRPLLQVAAMLHSVSMMDQVAEVCRKTICAISQNTIDEALGQDVFTADGLCWAYSRQGWTGERVILNTLSALEVLEILKNTPWKGMDREMATVLVNYFRGSSFYTYKGYKIPCLGQNTMSYKPERTDFNDLQLLKTLIFQWEDAFTKVDFKELKQLSIETQSPDPKMGMNSYYSGTRWFFNNEDLIKKNHRYHMAVNIASLRCDGPGGELAADAYNHFAADGATFFRKTGAEYQKAFGAYDVTAFPGVTAREGMKYITPGINKPGYCSQHNFAAGATAGGENAVAGFKFEKISVAERGRKGKRFYFEPEDIVLYGVRAHKSYFVLGDYMVALGAGITNKVPDVRRRIRTTIEQTECQDSVYLYKGNGIDWMIHKGHFAYSVFPSYKENAYHVCETKKTDWVKMNRLNKQESGLPEKVDIFRMWIDHGHNPVNDTYGYVVYAGEGVPPRDYPFEVLRNDTLIQAVKSMDNNVIGALFYDAKAVLNVGGISLSASSPCAVLVEKSDGYLILSITDALMDRDCKTIDIVWNQKKITCNMPQGKWCGQPAVYRSKLSNL